MRNRAIWSFHGCHAWQQGTALELMHHPRAVHRLPAVLGNTPSKARSCSPMACDASTSTARSSPSLAVAAANSREDLRGDLADPLEPVTLHTRTQRCRMNQPRASLMRMLHLSARKVGVHNTFASCACLTLHRCAQRVAAATSSPWMQPLPRSCRCRHAGHGCCHKQELASRMRVAALGPSSGPAQGGVRSSVSWAL